MKSDYGISKLFSKKEIEGIQREKELKSKGLKVPVNVCKTKVILSIGNRYCSEGSMLFYHYFEKKYVDDI